MPRKKYTPAMNAPKKQRSMKATKGAFRRTESILNSVTKAHTEASVETMNKTRI